MQDIRMLTADEILAVSGGKGDQTGTGGGGAHGTGPGTGGGDGLGWLRAIGGAIVETVTAVGHALGL